MVRQSIKAGRRQTAPVTEHAHAQPAGPALAGQASSLSFLPLIPRSAVGPECPRKDYATVIKIAIRPMDTFLLLLAVAAYLAAGLR